MLNCYQSLVPVTSGTNTAEVIATGSDRRLFLFCCAGSYSRNVIEQNVYCDHILKSLSTFHKELKMRFNEKCDSLKNDKTTDWKKFLSTAAFGHVKSM